ncbi:RNA polymerase sigma factor, sigma-70 family [Longilinea arvoryzae]|uniref:RNA polymerase sigma factor n=1 Tax=Longilinea arvoryzae TaxID=360412 RepID=A0A0S7BDY1_9CHLR|nr:RNA polymerase sigma factor, sigma-70 family [Longilinea arvoryzae]
MIADSLAKNFLQTNPKEQVVPPDQVHDFELLRRIAGKDEAALQELYAIHGQRLYAFALRLTDDPAQAEDVVQDALVAVWNLADSYRCEGRPIAWLMGIVHHTALKSLRRRSTPLSEEDEANLAAADPLPEEQAQANQQAIWIRQGLRVLSPEHRTVLELVFYQGLSLQETAKVCGCPLGTVKSRLNYARQRLRGLLSRTEETR